MKKLPDFVGPDSFEIAAKAAYDAVLRQVYGMGGPLTRPEDGAEREAKLAEIFRDAARRAVCRAAQAITEAAYKAIEADPRLATPMAVRWLLDEIYRIEHQYD